MKAHDYGRRGISWIRNHNDRLLYSRELLGSNERIKPFRESTLLGGINALAPGKWDNIR